MGTNILIALTFLFFITGAWIADLICYHPQPMDDVYSMASARITVALK